MPLLTPQVLMMFAIVLRSAAEAVDATSRYKNNRICRRAIRRGLERDDWHTIRVDDLVTFSMAPIEDEPFEIEADEEEESDE